MGELDVKLGNRKDNEGREDLTLRESKRASCWTGVGSGDKLDSITLEVLESRCFRSKSFHFGMYSAEGRYGVKCESGVYPLNPSIDSARHQPIDTFERTITVWPTTKSISLSLVPLKDACAFPK